MSENASNSLLRCVVVTPEQTVLDTEAEFVAMPLFDGEIGIGMHHSPMIGRLGYGELRIRNGSESSSFYVDGGFVQVADNVISVLTNRSIDAKDIDADKVEQQLKTTLEQKAVGDDQLALRDRSLSQTRAQLRFAKKAK